MDGLLLQTIEGLGDAPIVSVGCEIWERLQSEKEQVSQKILSQGSLCHPHEEIMESEASEEYGHETLMRPVGGILADRFGGARILVPVFIAVALLGVLMGCPWMPTFTVGALGAAAALGLGNGAVFKLVPQYFPKETATVTGLVGAFGGLGGFFPPLVLGVLRDAAGAYTWGFIFLAIFALFCLAINYRVFLKTSRPVRMATAMI
ncbi:MAG TPA: MFS transporter [Pyrinomonadaceae bacterium]